MRDYIVFRKNGKRAIYSIVDKNTKDYPPPHGYNEGDFSVEIMDDGEFYYYEDNDEVHEVLGRADLVGGLLKMNGVTLNVTVVEKSRMRNGFIEDKTTTGWRRRVVAQKVANRDGNISDLEEKYFSYGPMVKVNGDILLNRIEVTPSPEDRLVRSNRVHTEIKEVPIKERLELSKTALDWVKEEG